MCTLFVARCLMFVACVCLMLLVMRCVFFFFLYLCVVDCVSFAVVCRIWFVLYWLQPAVFCLLCVDCRVLVVGCRLFTCWC